ncbi:MAG: hypothetical protein CMO01_32910 [Thalassobius sp.]|nr:hypothetical protein [Thalassovita sp.]
MKKILGFLILLTALFIHVSNNEVLAQDETNKNLHFNGSVSVTNNGFSFIPSFSLGKPATIFDLSAGGEKFSFDPQFRFDLDGLKPWSIIFIWRYKLVETDKFLVKTGMHLLAIAFRSQTYMEDGISKERIVAQRFITPELTTAYKLTKKTSVGAHYIYGIGLEKHDQSDHTHFFSLRMGTEFDLSKKLFIKWKPEVYYLNIDGKDGYFTAQNISLNHRKIPLSLQTIMNQPITTDIDIDFDWNISLIYSFKNQLALKK